MQTITDPLFFVSGQYECDMGLIREVIPGARFVDRRRPEGGYSPDRYAGLIILGDDSTNAMDDAEFDYDRHWLEIALRQKQPVLAVCLGAQLLAGRLNGTPRLLELSRWRKERSLVRLTGDDYLMAALAEYSTPSDTSPCITKPTFRRCPVPRS